MPLELPNVATYACDCIGHACKQVEFFKVAAVSGPSIIASVAHKAIVTDTCVATGE